jgi:hypothetical protein
MAAITANRSRQNKCVEELYALPVKTGTTIYQGAIVGIDSTGHLIDAVEGVKMIGIVMDAGEFDPPRATTANGSLFGDRTSPVAGDKTVRLVALRGRFLMDFGVAIAQANLGDKAFASNNNDCALLTAAGPALGTIVSVVSTSQAWVELNTSVLKQAE